MASFIQLTSLTPGILGKIRVNIENIQIYFPTIKGSGATTLVMMGAQENVRESVVDIDKMIDAARNPFNGRALS